MKSPNGDCDSSCRFITGHLGTSAVDMPAAFLIIASLAMLVMVFAPACASPSSTSPPPSPHLRPTPISTEPLPPNVDPPTKPPPTLRSPVTLTEPENGSCLTCRSNLTLRWSCPDGLQEGEYYRLRVKGQNSSVYYCPQDSYHLSVPSPGEYRWAVAIVRSTGSDEYEPVSEESDWYRFEIAHPAPIVHSISPTTTVKGTSASVIVSGHNLTRAVAITIGVPLEASIVNSSTITATVPTTLEVDEYPVVVKDSLGQGESYASFTVSEPPPTPVPVTPRPVYPQPVLGGLDINGHDVTFHWSLTRSLGDDDHFALRVGIGTPGHSLLWTEDYQASWRFYEQGDYVWEVAICRGDPAERDCSGNKQLAVSERRTFWFKPPDPPKPTPPPP
jgi:hypothetical protein